MTIRNCKLDADPQRDDDASSLSSYRFMSSSQVKIKISNLLGKIFKFLGFHAIVATREDLSIDISITNVGLILTKLRRFQLFRKSQNSNFKLKKKLGFHAVVFVKTFPY